MRLGCLCLPVGVSGHLFFYLGHVSTAEANTKDIAKEGRWPTWGNTRLGAGQKGVQLFISPGNRRVVYVFAAPNWTPVLNQVVRRLSRQSEADCPYSNQL